MKIFTEDFIQANKKKFTIAIVLIVSIVLASAGLLVLFAVLTNDKNHILFRILSIVIAILGGSSIIFIICEIIKQAYKNIFFYNTIQAANKTTCVGRIVGIGRLITLQKGIKAMEYDLSTDGKTIKVYLNIEIQDNIFSLDDAGMFIIANNFIIEYEKE